MTFINELDTMFATIGKSYIRKIVQSQFQEKLGLVKKLE